MNEKALNRSIDLVMKERGLLHPEEITRLTDAEILRCPGVGRKAYTAIREIYPFDEEAVEQMKATALREKLDPIRQRLAAHPARAHIELGNIHGVVAARIQRGNLLIRVQGHKELLPIWLNWSPKVGEAEIPEGDGFGTVPEEGLIRLGISFPHLRGVHRVQFMDFQNDDDFWSAELQITTDQATFRIALYGDEEAPDGRAEEPEYSETISFRDEINEDPELAGLHEDLGKAWIEMDDALRAGSAGAALNALSLAIIQVETLMRNVISRAEARGIKLIDEPFGLTDTDLPELDYDINDDLIFEWSSFFPGWTGPLALIGRILRALLEERNPTGVANAKEHIHKLDKDLIPELQGGLALCEAIAGEIACIYADLKAVGEDGRLRKEIVARVDSRFPDDEGMARRAIKRWIDARVSEGEMLAVRSRGGQVLRLKEPASV